MRRDPGGNPRPARILTAAALLMVSLGSLYAWSVLVSPLESALDVDRGTVSGVFSLATVLFALGMLAGPALYHRTSAAGFGLFVCLLAAAGFAVAALGTVAAVAVGLGLLFGAANGLGYGFALQLVQRHLQSGTGAATGLIVAAYTAGSAGFAPLLDLGAARWGLAGTLMAMAIWFVTVGAAVAVLLRGVPPVTSSADSGDTARRVVPATFPLLWLGFALGATAGVLALAHAAPLVTALGGGGGEPALGASLAAIGNGVGRLLGGWGGERAAPLRSVAALQVLAMVGLMAALVAPGPETALVALGLAGLGYGWMAGAYPVTVARFYGPAQTARVYGRLFTAWGTAALIAPVLGGALFDRAGNYRAALAIAAAASLAAAGALTLLHRLRRSDHPRLD